MNWKGENKSDGTVGELPEAARLVLDLLQPDPPADLKKRLADLAPDQWREWTALVRMQQIRPVVYSLLKGHRLLEVVPEEVAAALHESFLANLARNLRFYRDLEQIVLWLREAEIPVIALKGAYLGRTVYDNIGLREMLDLDLLVPRGELRKAYRIVAGRGYHPFSDECRNEEEWIKGHNHMVGLEKEPDYVVELHWHVDASARWRIEEFWERSIPFQCEGLRAFSPEDLLLHLCYHVSYQHRFRLGLRPLLDLARVVAHFADRIDWSAVAERAERLGWKKGVVLALCLARNLVGAPIPHTESIFGRCGEDFSRWEKAAASLVMHTPNWRKVPPNVAKLWQERTWSAKLGILRDRIFLPPEQLAARYGIGPKSFKRHWYYLVRIKDLLWENRWMVGKSAELEQLVRQNSKLREWLKR